MERMISFYNLGGKSRLWRQLVGQVYLPDAQDHTVSAALSSGLPGNVEEIGKERQKNMSCSRDPSGRLKWHFHLSILVVLMLLSASGFAQGRFTINELKLKGEITNVIVEDLDRDGLKDLVVFHADTSIKTPQRWVTVLWQDKATGFELKRAYELQPGPEAAAMDVGQADGKEGLDLIAICPSGVVYYPNHGRSFGHQTLLVQKETALAMPSPRTLPYVDWVRDWNGDGNDELMLFQFGQALFFTGGKNGPDLNTLQTLALRPWSDILAASGVKGDAASQLDLVSMNTYLPRVYARDWDGDGRPDLIAVGRKDITVFIQDERGGYPSSSVRKYEVELFTPAEEHFSASPVYPYWPPSLSFSDLDHDGKADLVGQQLIGLLGKMKSKVVLYWGRTGSLSRGKPDMVFTPKNLAVMALVSDLNKDGLEDILIPTLGLSFFTVGRVFATGTFPVELNYYLQTRDHKFSNAPDYVRTLNLVFDLEKFRLAAGIPGVFDDFNGDGFPDAAIGKSKTQLEVIICDNNGKYTNVRESISLPVSSAIMVQDLNGDKKADIILNYFDDPDHRGELRILMNQGKW